MNEWSKHVASDLSGEDLAQVGTSLGLDPDRLRDGACFAAGAAALRFRGARAGKALPRRARGQWKALGRFTAVVLAAWFLLGTVAATLTWAARAESHAWVEYDLSELAVVVVWAVALDLMGSLLPVAGAWAIGGPPRSLAGGILGTLGIAAVPPALLWLNLEALLPVWACVCLMSAPLAVVLYTASGVVTGAGEYLGPPAEVAAVLEVLKGRSAARLR